MKEHMIGGYSVLVFDGSEYDQNDGFYCQVSEHAQADDVTYSEPEGPFLTCRRAELAALDIIRSRSRGKPQQFCLRFPNAEEKALAEKWAERTGAPSLTTYILEAITDYNQKWREHAGYEDRRAVVTAEERREPHDDIARFPEENI